MKTVRFHPEARIEMVAAAQYYEKAQEGLGRRFLEAVHSATRRIPLMPAIYQAIEGDIRRCCVEKFPFGLVFREKEDHIEIIALIHFKRRPGYWKDRI